LLETLKRKLYAFALFSAQWLWSVRPTTSPYTTKSTTEQQKGWSGYALLAPTGESDDMVRYRKQNQLEPYSRYHLTRNQQQFRKTISGTISMADVLWNNHIIGDFSSQGISDTKNTLTPNLHNLYTRRISTPRISDTRKRLSSISTIHWRAGVHLGS